MTMKQAIKEAYASDNVTTPVLDTIELLHPAFIDPEGRPVSIRAVIAFEPWILGLELDAPLNPGEMVKFEPIPFSITEAGFEEGQVPKLTFSISNVSREVSQYLEQAIAQTDKITLIYRNYLESDLSGPQIDPVITMSLTNAAAGVMSVTATANLADVHNWPFPWQRYTTDRFPGLNR